MSSIAKQHLIAGLSTTLTSLLSQLGLIHNATDGINIHGPEVTQQQHVGGYVANLYAQSQLSDGADEEEESSPEKSVKARGTLWRGQGERASWVVSVMDVRLNPTLNPTTNPAWS